MCSTICPCTDASAWLALSSKDLKKWKRAKPTAETPAGTHQDADGNIYLWEDKENGYKTYVDCIETLTEEGTTEEYEIDKKTRSAIGLLKSFESRHECSGICKKPHFYATIDVAEGPPADFCKEAIKEELNSTFRNLGAAILVASLFTLAFWGATFMLCKKFDNNKFVPITDQMEKQMETPAKVKKQGKFWKREADLVADMELMSKTQEGFPVHAEDSQIQMQSHSLHNLQSNESPRRVDQTMDPQSNDSVLLQKKKPNVGALPPISFD